jgi:FkbM family methyltransferase
LLRGGPHITHLRCFGKDVAIAHANTTASWSVIQKCFIQPEYEIPLTPVGHRRRAETYYEHLVARGRTPLIVDCGANIGASALWFHTRYPASHIVCVEPDDANFDLLRTNCPGTAFTHHRCAVGSRDRSASLVDPGRAEWREVSYQVADDATGGIAIVVRTIATLLSGMKEKNLEPFILKIDIEGSEKELFEREQWEDLAQFPIIFVEGHDFIFPGKHTFRNFLRFHLETGRDLMPVGENLLSMDWAMLSRATLNAAVGGDR